MRWYRLAWAPALAVTLLSTPAFAGPSAQDKAAAKQLAAEADAAMSDKHWMDAVTALRKAAKLDPTPAREVALAQALAAAGKLIDARKVLTPVAESAEKSGPARKAREAAKKALDDVTGRLAGVKVTVKGPPDGKASLLIDGIEVANADEITLNPGTHTVGAAAEGFEDMEKEVRFAAGAHLEVTLSMSSKAPAAGEGSGDDAKDKEKEKDKPHGSRAPGALTILLGTGGLVMGGVFGVMALKAGSAARAQCNGSVCPPAATRDIDEAKSVGQASNLAFVIGGALTVTGIVLAIVAPGAPVSDGEPAKSARVAPWIGPGVGGVGVSGRF